MSKISGSESTPPALWSSVLVVHIQKKEKQKVTGQVKVFSLCVAVLVVLVRVQQRREKELVDRSGQEDVRSQGNRKYHRVNKLPTASLLVIWPWNLCSVAEKFQKKTLHI